MVNKKTHIKERIKQVADIENVSYKKLYEIIKMTDSGFKGEHLKKPIKSDAISYLINAFPKTDLHWLITGEKKYAEHHDLSTVEEPKSSEDYKTKSSEDYKTKYFECTENYMKLNEELKALKASNSRIKKSNTPIPNKS